MASSSASQRPPPPPIPAASTGTGGTDTATLGTTGDRPEPENVEDTHFMIDMACACIDVNHWKEILIRDHDVNPASLDCHEGFGIPAIEHIPHELLVKSKLDKKIPEFDPSSFGKPLTWNNNGSELLGQRELLRNSLRTLPVRIEMTPTSKLCMM